MFEFDENYIWKSMQEYSDTLQLSITSSYHSTTNSGSYIHNKLLMYVMLSSVDTVRREVVYYSYIVSVCFKALLNICVNSTKCYYYYNKV